MKKFIKVFFFVFLAFIVLGAIGTLFADESDKAVVVETSSTPKLTETPAETEKEEPKAEEKKEEPKKVEAKQEEVKPKAPSLTMAQQNAVRSAQNYLDFSSFSKKGLIGQLEYEGYSNADATFAVESISVDWNEQAARSAKNYLDFSSFSRQGLIDQLVFEGYTQEQAVYGVTQVGY